jgi:hypothetical protein
MDKHLFEMKLRFLILRMSPALNPLGINTFTQEQDNQPQWLVDFGISCVAKSMRIFLLPKSYQKNMHQYISSALSCSIEAEVCMHILYGP